ncbi:MAG: flagellar hook assembly protein FlgD [Acidimicrobiales bacterium]
MINGISGIATSETSQPMIADSMGNDRDLFLKLLVAQVQYQDPLEPMDNQEYLAQTAQFTMVEQITRMAEQTSELLAFQRATLASGMIGQTVTAVDESEASTTGVVSGVDYNFGDPQLLIDGQRVGLDEVVAAGATPEEESTD